MYTTEELIILSDSKSALEAIINEEINITSSINYLLQQMNYWGRSCVMEWIPARINIEGNECADSIAKESRDNGQPCTTITVADANAVARYRFLPLLNFNRFDYFDK
ncbi:hypothetical protein TNCV_988401 [Trichonephila clavipes]|nr:hypothetical protein TNCV_988401 [Trichonephila clavipes]